MSRKRGILENELHKQAERRARGEPDPPPPRIPLHASAKAEAHANRILPEGVEYEGATLTFRPLDVNDWPCDFGCGHGHRPGVRCGYNGCECRA